MYINKQFLKSLGIVVIFTLVLIVFSKVYAAMTFNATSILMGGATSGTITLQPVAVAGSNTITLPATTGTVVTTGDTSGLSANLGISLFNNGTGASSSTFWRGDGTWATPAGGGGSSLPLYGSGVDGAIVFDGTTNPVCGATLSGSTYTMTRDCDATTFSISTGVILVPAGFRILATTSITLNGTATISANGSNGNAGGSASGTNGSVAGAQATSQSSDTASGTVVNNAQQTQLGNRGTVGIGGGTGAGSNGTTGASGQVVGYCWPNTTTTGFLLTSSAGGAGGAGGVAGANAGGTGGLAGTNGSITSLRLNMFQTVFDIEFGCTAFAQSVLTPWPATLTPTNASNGSGASGGGDGTNKGGGGGASGNNANAGYFIFLASPTITIGASAIIQSNGGIGGQGGNGGTPTTTTSGCGGGGGGAGGQGGNGGVIALVYHTLTNSGTIQELAGSGGTHGNGGTAAGTGVNGSNGNDGANGHAGLLLQYPQ